MQQTMLLEQILSAKQIPDELQTISGSLTEIIDIEYENKENNRNIDLRQSRILEFPTLRKDSNKNTTVLTAYVQLCNEEGKYNDTTHRCGRHLFSFYVN